MSEQRSLLARVRGLVRGQWLWAAIAIVVLLLINVIKDPTYLSLSISPQTSNLVGNLIDILRASAPVLMIAVGMCLVIATRGIDLSVGSSMVVAGAASMEYLQAVGQPESAGAAATAVLLALACAAAVGAINGALVTIVGLQPFISTLVMMLAGRGIAKVITSGQNTDASNAPFQWLTNGYVLGFPVVFLIAIGIVVVVALFVRRTAFGLMIESVGINPDASRMAGIRPRGLLMAVYILSGILAGMAGIFAVGGVMRVNVSQTGYQLEMDAILAVVIGGTSLAGGKFSIGGAVVGGLLIATLDKTVVFLGVPASATPAFKAIVIVVLCLLQSRRVRALFARRRSRPGIAVPATTVEGGASA